MKTITIETKKYEVERTRTGYRSFNAELDGKELTSTIDGKVTAVEFIERAVSEVVTQAINNSEDVIDITVSLPADITLTESLKTYLTDKFEADPVVNSVTFA